MAFCPDSRVSIDVQSMPAEDARIDCPAANSPVLALHHFHLRRMQFIPEAKHLIHLQPSRDLMRNEQHRHPPASE